MMFSGRGTFYHDEDNYYKSRREAIQVLRTYFKVIGKRKKDSIIWRAFNTTLFIVESIKND